jgi:hypothetical protein
VATDDQQVLVTGTASAPASWTVPGNGQIRPKAIYATFDGTGASGDFMPFLEIISDGGEVIAQSAGSTVTAGGSVEQTWFPRVGTGGSGSGPVTALTNWAYIAQSGHTTCGAGATTVLSATLGSFYTNASSVYTTGTDGSGHNGIVISANGHYACYMSVAPFGTPTAGAQYECVTSGGGATAALDMAPLSLVFPSGGFTSTGNLTDGNLMTVGGFISPPTDPIVAQINNTGASSVNLSMMSFIYQLDTDNTDL